MSRNPLALIGVQTNSTDHASGNLAISDGGQIILSEVTVSDVREHARIDQASDYLRQPTVVRPSF